MPAGSRLATSDMRQVPSVAPRTVCPAILRFATLVTAAWLASIHAAPEMVGAQQKKTLPASVGQWTPPFAWPDVAIHIHLLPNGNVLTWADDDEVNYATTGLRLAGFTKAYVWTIGTSPSSPQFAEIDNRSTNLFCSGHAFLADGRLLVNGGHGGTDGAGVRDTNIFDYRAQAYGAWFQAGFMTSGRWYPSSMTLANGDVITLAGSGSGDPAIPEVYSDASGGWRQLTTARRDLPYYPFLHHAPDGRVFVAGPDRQTAYLDTSGTGRWTNAVLTNWGSRDYGPSVSLGTKVYNIGGGDPPTNTVETIDIGASPLSARYVASMAYPRRQANGTVLPDGTVLVTGGTTSGGFNTLAGAVYVAELYDPARNRWTKMASMQIPRLYHSSTALLPDGRVLSAGGGRPNADGEPSGTEHRNAEVFSPPYLFKGARPTIASTPSTIGYNQSFFVGTPDAASIANVTMIRLSSTSHTANTSEQFARLTYSVVGGGLQVQAPLSRNLVPPGFYLLFILNTNGVPSIARFVQIR